MKNLILFLLAIMCATAHAQLKPTQYDTNTDAVAQLFVRSQIGQQVGPTGSNYLIAATAGTQIAGSNYLTSPLTNGAVSIYGVINASAAVSGTIGEFTNKIVPFSSATNLLTDVPTNIITLTLSPGDWDVEGAVNVTLTSASVTRLRCGITTTSSTIPVDGTAIFSGVQTTSLSISDSASIPRTRINTPISTNVFLVLQETFSAGTVVGYGTISARRVR